MRVFFSRLSPHKNARRSITYYNVIIRVFMLRILRFRQADLVGNMLIAKKRDLSISKRSIHSDDSSPSFPLPWRQSATACTTWHYLWRRCGTAKECCIPAGVYNFHFHEIMKKAIHWLVICLHKRARFNSRYRGENSPREWGEDATMFTVYVIPNGFLKIWFTMIMQDTWDVTLPAFGSYG